MILKIYRAGTMTEYGILGHIEDHSEPVNLWGYFTQYRQHDYHPDVDEYRGGKYHVRICKNGIPRGVVFILQFPSQRVESAPHPIIRTTNIVLCNAWPRERKLSVFHDISVRNNLLFTYFPTGVPSNSCVFLSCRPFVINTTFSTGCWSFFCLLTWAVDSWSLNHWLL